MTEQEKQLLLKDLCARLPYDVVVRCYFVDGGGEEVLDTDDIADLLYNEENGEFPMYKPYLRPMSSMTEEEKEEMHFLLSPTGTAIYENGGIAIPANHYGEFVPYEFMNRIIQYLLKNHFDFMDLIPKGLALEAPEEMYKN